MHSYQKLTVWQKSMELAEQIYIITSKLPKNETFGISSQMQRAAVAIPSNIAEGSKRNHKAEFIQYLAIANGSAAELETQLLLAKSIFKNLSIDFEKPLELVTEVLKMLYSLQTSFKNK